MSEFYEIFNHQRYQNDGRSLQSSGDDIQANAGKIIQIYHIPTGNTINFKAFIESFTETYKTNWASEQLLGRTDPLYLFKDTARTISISFKVPASSKGEAYENLGKIQKLVQFLYPTYTNPAQAQTIIQSPVLRVKFMNILRDTNNLSINGLDVSNASNVYESYDMEGQGLLGYIGSLSLQYNLDSSEGVIEKFWSADTSGAPGSLQAILPKLIEVNFDFNPIHEHTLGWNANDQFGVFTTADENGSNFPYGAPLHQPAPPATPAPPNSPLVDGPPEGGPEDPEQPVDEPEEETPTAGEDEEQAAEEGTEESLDRECRIFCNRRDRDDRDEDEPWTNPNTDFIGIQYGERSERGSWSDMTGRDLTIDPGSLYSEEEQARLEDPDAMHNTDEEWDEILGESGSSKSESSVLSEQDQELIDAIYGYEEYLDQEDAAD